MFWNKRSKLHKEQQKPMRFDQLLPPPDPKDRTMPRIILQLQSKARIRTPSTYLDPPIHVTPFGQISVSSSSVRGIPYHSWRQVYPNSTTIPRPVQNIPGGLRGEFLSSGGISRSCFIIKSNDLSTVPSDFSNRGTSSAASKPMTLYDSKMSARQTMFNKLPTEERKEQEIWAQQRLRASSFCVRGFDWLRISGGYRCKGGYHIVTDELLAEGRGRYFENQIKCFKLSTDPPSDGNIKDNWVGPFDPALGDARLQERNDPTSHRNTGNRR